MKKLFLLFGILISIQMMAQDYTLLPKDIKKDITISDADTVGGTTQLTYSWWTARNYAYYYDHYIELDSLGDGSDVYVVLQGSYNNSDWYDITSVTWGAVSEDTTIRFNNLTTSNSVASYTETTAAYNILQDTTGMATYFADTIKVPAVTRTIAAQTTTISSIGGACSYPYQRFKMYGAGASSGANPTEIRLAFIKPFIKTTE